jgi:ATP-dependent helicase Lhr and Lhr-like helicase
VLPSAKRAMHARRRGARKGMPVGMDEAGRWALVRRAPASSSIEVGEAQAGTPSTSVSTAHTFSAKNRPKPRIDPHTLEHIATVLLRRYGVVFWRLLEREADWLPSWRELLPVFHRLEARGEIRGGRFVAGIAGEQFALPEAIPVLREVRRRDHDGICIAISGVDPLNLCGTLLPGDKVPALANNRIVLRDGIAVATLIAGKTHMLVDVDPATRDRIRDALVVRRNA